jgi:hypothetical protein
MQIVIIPQKQVGTGCLTDIQSEHLDREVCFKEDALFAFVKGANYQDDKHRFFKTLDQANVFAADSNFVGEIIENDGSRYVSNVGYIGKF